MAPLAPASWSEVGRVIARFHRNAVYHADLNARNILLNSAGQVFLIDFDKGRIRPRHRHRWAPSNLKRLLRSLNKCKRLNPRLCFSEADWACLLEGYES
jgi:3-deoxy-D-manno-octulosonic acid kinase